MSVSESSPIVSSAKRSVSMSVDRWRSLIKHKNKMGPSMLPCSTEMSISRGRDMCPSMSTHCCLSLR